MLTIKNPRDRSLEIITNPDTYFDRAYERALEEAKVERERSEAEEDSRRDKSKTD